MTPGERLATRSGSAPWSARSRARARGAASSLRCALPLGLALCALAPLGPREARAQSAPAAAPSTTPFPTVLHRFSLRGELGGAALLGEYQRASLGFGGFGGAGSLRAAVYLHPVVALQIAGANWLFPRGNELGGVVSVTGGVRVEPQLGQRLRLVADLEAGLGVTADRYRFYFGGAVGLDVLVAGPLSLGPVVRYGHLVAAPGASTGPNVAGAVEAPYHAPMLAFGLALALRAPPANGAASGASPQDRDGDSIVDPDDLCPEEPAGRRPDARRPGCPERDSDGDSVVDQDDLCIDVPQGAHPDPARRGCPQSDTDGDGVFDAEDRCVTTPQGAHPDPTRPGCPDGDDDNDRVRNAADQCPQQHAGYHPDPARAGCPSPDGDRDSVSDPDDACPAVPGAPSPDPRRNGCPGLVRMTDEQIEILRPVFFATNRDTILPRSDAVLVAVADALRATGAITRLRVEGHTDDTNDEAFNLDLSRRRAENVRRWLVEHGVAAGRLEAEGFGEARALVPVTALRGGALTRARAQNRRVEFRVVSVGE